MFMQKYVVDVMLPLDEYTVVSEDETLYDAFVALEEAKKNLPPGRHSHKAVLVINKKKEIVGKIGHLGFLKALDPGYQNIGQLDMLSKAGLTREFVTSMMKNYELLQDDLSDVRRRTKSIKLKDVMHPIKEHIDINDSINEAIHKIIMWQALSVPVTKDNKVVGILRLADLFDAVSSIILEK